MEEMQSWESQKMTPSEDFHLEEKVDPVESLINKVGWDSAWSEINDTLDRNPEDPEARRQATLAKVLLEKELKRLNDKLLH